MPSQIELAKADEPRQHVQTDAPRSATREDGLNLEPRPDDLGFADPRVLMRLQATAGNAAVAQLLGARQRGVTVQREPDAATAAALQGRAQSQIAAAAPKTTDAKPAPAPAAVDAAELAAKKKELRGGIPVPPQAASQAPVVEQAASAAKEEVHKAPEPVAKPKAQVPPKSEQPGPGPMAAAAAAGKLAADAFAAAATPEVPAPVEGVVPPQPVALTDAGGAPLPPDPGADPLAASIAGKIQRLRLAGQRLRHDAAQQTTAAHHIKGTIHATEAKIGEGEAAVSTLQSHTAYRREVNTNAKSALEVAEQKAATVAEQAPAIAAKAGAGQQKSGPLAGEASRLAGENASKQPDDADAASKSREQGSKLNKVGSDLGTMNDAVSQSGTRAQGLVEEAAAAKAKNAETKGKIGETEASIAQTEARLTELSSQNAAAKDHLAGLSSGPGEMLAAAHRLDKEGEGFIQASIQLEAGLHQSRAALAGSMQAVPAAQRPELAASESVQRAGYEDRVNLDWGGAVGDAVPSWLTGETPSSAQARMEAKQAADKQHRAELAEINKEAGGNFRRLSEADKAGIALRLTGRHLWQSVGSTSFPNFIGGIARAFVDPRVSLMGVVAGLSMTISGVANLLSAEQWKKDPLGNALKSAADIATGITIVLGSIAGLAVAIIVVLTALTILSFGLLGPVAAAVIPFCATVAATVGPWAITAAEIALLLQGLVLIKNLIDAATAQTSDELETKSEQMTEDAKAAGQMAMQVGMAKAMTALGEYVKGEPPAAVTEPHPVDVTAAGDLAPGNGPAEVPIPAEPGAGMPKSGLELDTAPRQAPVEPVEPHPVAAGPEGPSGLEIDTGPRQAPVEPVEPHPVAAGPEGPSGLELDTGPKQAPVEPVEPGAEESAPTQPKATEPTKTGGPEEPPGEAPATAEPAQDPEAIGRAIGKDLRGQRGAFHTVAAKINAAKLPQSGAVSAVEGATAEMGLRMATVKLPDGRIVVSSVMPGNRVPVMVVEPNGNVFYGSADLSVDLTNPADPIRIENVTPREAGPAPPPAPKASALDDLTKAAEPAKSGGSEPPSQEPPTAAGSKKPRVLRLDDDFNALKNDRGQLKSHLNPDGSLAPANPTGDCTPLEHIYGSQPAKGNSPYSSFMTEGEGGLAKAYGQSEIELDLPKLEADIKAGNLPGVEVLTPGDLESMIQGEIETTAKQAGVKIDIKAALEKGPEGISEYLGGIDGLSRTAAAKLARRLLALFNTTRDGEVLVKGVIPAQYLTEPKLVAPVP